MTAFDCLDKDQLEELLLDPVELQRFTAQLPEALRQHCAVVGTSISLIVGMEEATLKQRAGALIVLLGQLVIAAEALPSLPAPRAQGGAS